MDYSLFHKLWIVNLDDYPIKNMFTVNNFKQVIIVIYNLSFYLSWHSIFTFVTEKSSRVTLFKHTLVTTNDAIYVDIYNA